MDIANRLRNTGTALYANMNAVGRGIRRGVLYCSLAMHDIYSLDGFEKWTKGMISTLRLASRLPSIKGVFDKCLETLEPQKDLYYATMAFKTTGDFVTKENGVYHVALPRKDKKDRQGDYVKDSNGKKATVVDWVKVMHGIGNPFDTGCFLQRYNVMSFPFFSKIATRLGSIKLFSYGGSDVEFGNFPLLETLCSKPKDFFMFFASAIAIYDLRFEKHPFSLINLAKLVASFGKMTLITAGKWLTNHYYFTTIAVLDFIASNASLLNLILKKHELRQERFNNPLAS